MATQTTVIPLPPDLVQRDRVRRQALRVGGIRHEGLAVLRDVAFVSEGLALTWEVPMGASAFDAAEPREAAEILRMLAPIAAGLALLHDAGLAHGGVRPSGIVHVDGSGVLVGWIPGGTPADDVCDLAGLLDRWLPSASVGADIAQVVIAGIDPEPQVRPSMARIAAVLERAASRALPPMSPPAHRRARVPEPELPPEPSVSSLDAASPRAVRGRHAARHASAGRSRPSMTRRTVSRPLSSSRRPPSRVPWRWTIAGAGVLAAAFLGFTAVGSADVVCPAAPIDSSAVTSTRSIDAAQQSSIDAAPQIRIDPARETQRATSDRKQPAGSPTKSSGRSR